MDGISFTNIKKRRIYIFKGPNVKTQGRLVEIYTEISIMKTAVLSQAVGGVELCGDDWPPLGTPILQCEGNVCQTRCQIFLRVTVTNVAIYYISLSKSVPRSSPLSLGDITESIVWLVISLNISTLSVLEADHLYL